MEYDSSLSEGDSTTDRFCSRVFSMLSSCSGDTSISAGTSASFGLFFIVFSSSSSERFFSMSSSACFTTPTSALRTCTSWMNCDSVGNHSRCTAFAIMVGSSESTEAKRKVR